MKEKAKAKAKIVVGSGCPYCLNDLDEVLHVMWDSNLQRPEIQPDIKKGRNRFAPFGTYVCPACGKTVSINLYGDLEGFVSFLFPNEETRKIFVEKALKPALEKGLSPKSMHEATEELIKMGKIVDYRVMN